MKKRILLSSSLLISLLVVSSYSLNLVDFKDEVLIKLMMRGLNSGHYQAQDVDDAFSEEVFDLYLKRMDYNKRYFTQEDIEALKTYHHDIDNEVQVGNYEFFDASLERLRKGMTLAKGYYKEILDAPFDFDKKEEIVIDPDKLDYAADDMDLRERWRKILKYQTLVRLHNMMEDQEEAKEKGTMEKELTYAEMEAKAREKVRKNYDDTFKRIDKLTTKDWRNRYVDAIANTFDPHTGYFPPKDKENFDIQMSGRLEGIGATLVEQADGYIKVDRIVPGSASYRQGELKAGDLILKVAQAGAEPVDVVDMRLDEAVKMIRGKKGTEVRLTVKKLDGTTKVIPIVRDIVELEETYAKSTILDTDETDQKVGYIKLPKFYSNFNSSDGRTSFKDVAREIEKLKAEGVEKIILDLRNNGGGSLQDVVDMVGLFIPQGPVVQVKSRTGRPYVLTDRDPRVQFDGSLAVMVNQYSASASEILAAAIQDYGRGVIVGSTSTFGKGTVQRFINLDNFVVDNNDGITPLGAVKLTTQKFYRINGGATQLKGVTPDIILPDSYQFLDIGEREQEYSMPWDEIRPVKYDAWMEPALKPFLSKARKNSQARVKDNSTFQLLEENAHRLKSQRDQAVYPLDYAGYDSFQKKTEEAADRFRDVFKEINGFDVANLPQSLKEIEGDEVKEKANEEWIEDIKQDPYIYETLMILNDIP
ncbi:MAG: carboxy terminal-processing peptidase [Bacteroidota bacterium]